MTYDLAIATPTGRKMISDLLAMHRPLRADVAVLRDALGELSLATVDPGRLDRVVKGLTVADLAWQLQYHCQYFCQGLELHHAVEDARMLPTMARRFPELREAVARLRTEHDEVNRLIREIARAAQAMSSDDRASVDSLRDMMAELASHLEKHLDFEEQSLFPYFARMETDWHYG
ncbi:Hemerythrin HHE cation binding domain-containing protein [Sinosporangium album]|uniref:Hemerythrin HHE cation binding domain-containing protein n=1 Tax=Sinosporangium album TaxID=504805 RepID=A0A1G8C935_9ACTN|nr:hemerythrin domain-containing protein [Sinosporangium album]SDH41823.1 Hemerythrin HHE cation binding domain-containing protein [Sinosporangium album]